MARRTKHYFLAPMDQEELEQIFRIIYADRLPGNPYRFLAEDLRVEFDQVLVWGAFTPFPAEIACGLRVRAAILKGEMPDMETTVLSLLNVGLVVRWISEKASGNDVIKLFKELGRRFQERRIDASRDTLPQQQA